MHQQLQDAMAIVQRYGKPHLFITMTANTNWKEILEQLEPGQTALDRPDIVDRVFQAKKKKFIEELENGIYFKFKARVHTIEMQKRGAPHTHLELWFEDPFVATAAVLDSMISAEIPDENSPIYDQVKKFYLHGPCGPVNPQSPCMIDGVCSKNFPKDFRSNTDLGEDSFAMYRRRSPQEGGNSVTKIIRGQSYVMDNRYVVPYSPYLVQRFNCHINVEFVASIKSIKYLFKYTHKGSDMVTMQLEGNPDIEVIDEPKEFIQKRYVSSTEACWRVFNYELCARYPAVERLPIHLPEQQTVLYNPHNSDPAGTVLITAKKTKLTAYFAANQTLEHAADVFYRDFPEHFVWVQKNKEWKTRKHINARTIGRIVTIHPQQVSAIFLGHLYRIHRHCCSYLCILHRWKASVCASFF